MNLLLVLALSAMWLMIMVEMLMLNLLLCELTWQLLDLVM